MANEYGAYFSYIFNDFELSADGDLAIRNNDLSIIGGDDLQLQEIALVFRDKINPKEFMGFSNTGNEGRAIGDLLKERIWGELQSNPAIDSTNLSVNVYPMPDNRLNVDIYRTFGNESIPITNGTINFTDGTIEGLSQRQIDISDIYDKSSSVDQIEIIHIDTSTNIIEIKHPLTSDTSLRIYDKSDDALNGNTVKTVERELKQFDMKSDEIIASNIFPELLHDNIEVVSISATNENGTPLNIDIDDDLIITTSAIYNTNYNDIIIRVTYQLPIASSVNQNIISNNSLMMVDQRMLFPYSRFFGKIVITLDTIIEPGTYIAVYKRYGLS